MNPFSTGTLVFLMVALLLYRLLPRRARPFLLLAAGLLFYGLVQPDYLPILLVNCLVVWGLGKRLSAIPRNSRKPWLIGGILAVVSPLLVFKYTNFFLRTVKDLLQLDFSPLHILAPLGISFYTFRMISYLADVARDRCPAEPDFLYLTLYITWFPQILSGPIERSNDLMPQLKNPAPPDVRQGTWRILAGLFKKMVVAERLALFVNPLFRDPAAYDGITLVFGAVFFYLQIYCDFAGYTDLAVGISRLLGVRSAENFDYPLASRNVADFWRRWHISLSFWLRDYIFLPLSYSGLRLTEKWGRRMAEMFVYIGATTTTMLIAGLWHGAGWNFVTWGLIHALFLAISRLTRRVRKRIRRTLGLHRRSGPRKRIQTTLTFILITFSWIFFRAGTVEKALAYLSHMGFRLSGVSWGHLATTLVFAAAFLVAEAGTRRGWWKRLRPGNDALSAVLYAFFLCLLILFAVDGSNEFIYFRF